MTKYHKETIENKIIFTDSKDGKELIVTHYEEDYISDTIILDDTYSIDFILYIVKNLKETNDLLCLDVLFDSKELEKSLERYGLKVSNYEYEIKNRKSKSYKQYEITDSLDEEAKAYYLKKLNEATKINHKYYNPSQEESWYTKNVFKVGDYSYLVYKENGKIVGIVDYKYLSFDDFSNSIHEVYNHNNKVCIRSLFGENERIMINILNDLLNRYEKDIIISITYTEKKLRKAVISCGGTFNKCLYLLIK